MNAKSTRNSSDAQIPAAASIGQLLGPVRLPTSSKGATDVAAGDVATDDVATDDVATDDVATADVTRDDVATDVARKLYSSCVSRLNFWVSAFP